MQARNFINARWWAGVFMLSVPLLLIPSAGTLSACSDGLAYQWFGVAMSSYVLTPTTPEPGLTPPTTPLTYKNEIEAVDYISRQLEQQLRSASARSIFVRHFRGPGSNELQITNLLTQSLERQFPIGPGGAEIEGRVRSLPGANDGPASGYRITVSVETQSGIELPGVSVDVMNDIEANMKLKESGAVRPQPPREEGRSVDPIRLQKPPISDLIVGSRIYAAPGSPYSMEILVRDPDGNFVPRQPFIEQDAIVVKLERGEVYRVRVFNDSVYEAFAFLNIDGLGRFALSHDPQQRRNIDLVKTKANRDFVGYYLTPDRAASFMVGSYEDSVAKRVLGDAPDIGTISVAFGCTWVGDNIPAFERETKQVERQITETINVPVEVVVPRTIVEQVEVPIKGAYGSRAGGPPPTRTETRTRTVMETRTEMRQEMRTRTVVENQVVGTTEGPAVGDNVRTVSRKFGLTRAVIKVRYYATN
ncbi:MAG TPA: hypothetical protein PKD64_12755 [Pirellulaceae bacterium]|nr:hypothetical protein [Pirellulaceae bacterium]HMO93057.1 hypothetical protein [Pirellulaceae bacterium]HMP69687.1 hypothetical protein [Pirellulaceae bacterium]